MTRPILTLADAEAQAAAFLAARKPMHGNLRMEDDGTGATGDDGNKPDGSDGDDGNKPDETPEEKAARLEAENADLKKNSRKWEDRAKANKEKAAEFDKLQASSASDAEKLQAAIARGDKAERELARYRVAADTGLPADLAEMLTGEDEEAMEAQAKKLLARITPAKPKPKADQSQGGQGKDSSKLSAADEGKAEAQRRIAARKKS